MGLLTTIHSIGEFHEDGVLFHDTLNVLATNTDNTLVVLIGYVEGDGSRHLLLDEGQALLHGVVVGSNDVNIEVILSEALEHNLDVACDIVSSSLQGYTVNTYSGS